MSTIDPARGSMDDAGAHGSRASRHVPASLALMFVSGFAGLGYQVVWTQQCSLWLGHEAAAVLAVVAAFFGGIAAGATFAGPAIERSRRPVRWYASCELVIAAWSLVLFVVMPWFGDRMLDVIGAQPSPLWHWTVAFVGTFALLLPATAAMGATLPAIERVSAEGVAAGRSIAGFYASNTLGAVVGVLATAFWLVPLMGLSCTALLCSGLNLACGLAARVVLGDRPRTGAPMVATDGRRVRMRLAFTGLFGIGYEVVVVRVLSEVSEDTVYTFAMLLAVYLAGTALGAALYQRWLAKAKDMSAVADRLACALSLACLLGTTGLWGAESVKAWWLATIGDDVAAAIGAEAFVAVLAFGLPTIAMGALFSHLCRQAHGAGIGFGRALGINAIAATAAPLLFGVVLIPLVGPKWTLLLIAVGYLALTTPSRWREPIALVPAGIAAIVALGAPALAFVDIPEGGRVISYSGGITASVSVVEDGDGVSRLRIDNRQQEGTSATLHVDGRQALLPLLLHPDPRRALFLGLGTGMTASSAAEDPRLEVDAVELLPEVISASRHFTQAFDDGVVNPRLHLLAADARRWVKSSDRRYDVIVSDNFHPARAGSGALYTVEHFAAVRARLADGGLFCQWLPLHQLDLDTLRSIVRSFVAVNPDAWALLASNSLGTPVLGLVARRDAGRFRFATVRERLATSALPTPPEAFGIDDAYALLGSFVAGPKALARFAGDAPANTDDAPIVAYRAPRITYAADSSPQDRLFALLARLSIEPTELVDDDDPETLRRLAAYGRARDRFLAAGRDVRPSSDVEAMLAQVRDPLLSVLATSPDFRPAYDPLLRMAASLARRDPDAARGLLSELARLQPARAEAAQTLQALDRSRP